MNKLSNGSLRQIGLWSGILAILSIIGFVLIFSYSFFTNQSELQGVAVVSGSNSVHWEDENQDLIRTFFLADSIVPGQEINKVLNLVSEENFLDSFVRINLITRIGETKYDLFEIIGDEDFTDNWERLDNSFYYIGSEDAVLKNSTTVTFSIKFKFLSNIGNELQNKSFSVVLQAEVKVKEDFIDNPISFWDNAPDEWLEKSGKLLEYSVSSTTSDLIEINQDNFEYVSEVNSYKPYVFDNNEVITITNKGAKAFYFTISPEIIYYEDGGTIISSVVNIFDLMFDNSQFIFNGVDDWFFDNILESGEIVTISLQSVFTISDIDDIYLNKFINIKFKTTIFPVLEENKIEAFNNLDNLPEKFIIDVLEIEKENYLWIENKFLRYEVEEPVVFNLTDKISIRNSGIFSQNICFELDLVFYDFEFTKKVSDDKSVIYSVEIENDCFIRIDNKYLYVGPSNNQIEIDSQDIKVGFEQNENLYFSVNLKLIEQVIASDMTSISDTGPQQFDIINKTDRQKLIKLQLVTLYFIDGVYVSEQENIIAPYIDSLNFFSFNSFYYYLEPLDSMEIMNICVSFNQISGEVDNIMFKVFLLWEYTEDETIVLSTMQRHLLEEGENVLDNTEKFTVINFGFDTIEFSVEFFVEFYENEIKLDTFSGENLIEITLQDEIYNFLLNGFQTITLKPVVNINSNDYNNIEFLIKISVSVYEV